MQNETSLASTKNACRKLTESMALVKMQIQQLRNPTATMSTISVPQLSLLLANASTKCLLCRGITTCAMHSERVSKMCLRWPQTLKKVPEAVLLFGCPQSAPQLWELADPLQPQCYHLSSVACRMPAHHTQADRTDFSTAAVAPISLLLATFSTMAIHSNKADRHVPHLREPH